MSKIGKQPITIPQGVSVEVGEGRVAVAGGALVVPFPPMLSVAQEDDMLKIVLIKQTKDAYARWGLTRALLANAITGVSQGFSKCLILEGIGYRVALEGNDLVLSLGFSHPVRVVPPEGIRFTVEKNVITILGYDKQLVGNVAASIRRFRKPEPYKGKGIRYEKEIVRRKAGKKAAATK